MGSPIDLGNDDAKERKNDGEDRADQNCGGSRVIGAKSYQEDNHYGGGSHHGVFPCG